MIGTIASNFGRFVFFILLQALILNNIRLGGYLNPYAYIFILLALPLEFPRWANLLVGALVGLTLDLFTRTPGMHTTAWIFLGYIKPVLLRLLAPREGYEFGTTPTIKDLGITWYLTYAGILTFLHHIFLFMVEAFSFDLFWFTLSKALLSSLLTLLLLVIFQFLMVSQKQSN